MWPREAQGGAQEEEEEKEEKEEKEEEKEEEEKEEEVGASIPAEAGWKNHRL